MKTNPICVLSIGLCFSTIHGYENTEAHPELNRAIVTHSEAYLKNKLPANYLLKISGDRNNYSGTAVIDPGYSVNTFSEGKRSMTGFEWIMHGGFSADEPELASAIRHFYDPVKLSDGRTYLTNRGTFWEGAYPNPEIDAIEWAMGESEKGADNEWSLKAGKDHLIDALQSSDSGEKRELLANAFRCLGEVLHNTADMGCPAHVRNDSHAAPLGYDYDPGLGSPDPYEEMFSPRWAADFAGNKPDPALEISFKNAASIHEIHEKLAEFTNRNFFTAQTINGAGRINDYYNAINEDGRYPQPLLQNLDYDFDKRTYTYTRDFPSGNKVKMCKDHRILSSGFGSYPYIDNECVNSQASELVPNILCAGAHVIRLFLPEFRINILEANKDNVKGEIIHLPSDEYTNRIYYRGPVELIDAGTNKSRGKLDCVYGKFQGKIDGIDEEDLLLARIDFGGITIQSTIYMVDAAVDNGIQNITVWISANMPSDDENQRVGLMITNLKPSDKNVTVPLVWSGTSFSVQYLYSYLPVGGELPATLRGTITGECSGDFKKLIRLDCEETCQYPEMDGSVLIVIEQVELENIDLIVQANAYIANYSGSSWQQNLKSIYFSGEWSDSPELTYTSDTIDWNSSTPASLNIMMNLIEQ